MDELFIIEIISVIRRIKEGILSKCQDLARVGIHHNCPSPLGVGSFHPDFNLLFGDRLEVVVDCQLNVGSVERLLDDSSDIERMTRCAGLVLASLSPGQKIVEIGLKPTCGDPLLCLLIFVIANGVENLTQRMTKRVGALEIFDEEDRVACQFPLFGKGKPPVHDLIVALAIEPHGEASRATLSTKLFGNRFFIETGQQS